MNYLDRAKELIEIFESIPNVVSKKVLLKLIILKKEILQLKEKVEKEKDKLNIEMIGLVGEISMHNMKCFSMLQGKQKIVQETLKILKEILGEKE